jgi:probable HAF family extracellular repeat protein
MSRHIRTVAVWAGVVGGLVAAAAPSQAQPDRGVVVDLGVDECARDVNGLGVVVTDTHVYRQGRTRPLPGGLDSAARLNDHGQIAGSADGVAALWDGRAVVPIGVAGPADTYSYVTGLNDRGDVVGTSGSLGGGTTAFVWSAGVVRALPDLGSDAGASGINDAGQVVGYVWDGTGTQHAALWQPDGTLALLGALGDGGGHSLATAVDDGGDAVGYSYASSGGGTVRAVRWPHGQAAEPVDGDDTVFGVASDVNATGRVVGNVVPASGSQQGFVRDREGDLRLVAPLVEGDTTVLNAVNASGTAVGCEFSDTGSRAIMLYASR